MNCDELKGASWLEKVVDDHCKGYCEAITKVNGLRMDASDAHESLKFFRWKS